MLTVFYTKIMLSRHSVRLQRLYSQLRAREFRTAEKSPINHNENQIGMFYNVNPEVCKQLFQHGGLPRSFFMQTKTFTETTIMIRKPALDIINCIKSTDMSKPAVRYVLYGENGTGKSLTMAHLLHYAHEDGFLMVHVPWVPEWLRRVTRNKEMSNSSSREGLVDLPLDSAAWLIHFKTQNYALLKHLNLTISQEYVWSKRESTPAGAPLLQLVEHGLNRVKYASDVIDALIKEIKILSSQKLCKTFVAIDGFNCFFYPTTRLRTSTKRTVTPSEVTLTNTFLELTRNDWSNGVIVVAADQLAVPDEHQESFLPYYLLHKQGFEHLDPFVCVEVKRYSDKEYATATAYYRDRLWLRGPDELDVELKFTSACNPYQLMQQCAPL